VRTPDKFRGPGRFSAVAFLATLFLFMAVTLMAEAVFRIYQAAGARLSRGLIDG